jgi:hypothetical protein
MFYCFQNFPDHEGTMDPGDGYNLCFEEVDGLLCFCGVFGHTSLLILQSPITGVLGTPARPPA